MRIFGDAYIHLTPGGMWEGGGGGGGGGGGEGRGPDY